MHTRGSHCSEMTRTNPSEALERLAMTLNYPRREPISINELSEKTDLSWATTQKYVKLLETLGRIAPKISVDENGVTPKGLGDNLYDIRDQDDIQLVIYLFTHAQIKGSPTAPLNTEDHRDVLCQYEDTIDELVELGWLEESGDSIKLTPEGVSIAGPAYSRIRNNDIDIGPKHVATRVPTPNEQSHEANILVDDPTEGGDQFMYSRATNADADWEGGYSRDNKDDFKPATGISS